jgi:acyl-CoA thioester hydrolase
MEEAQGEAARITVQRRVEWADTDASGHHHFTAVLRWAEEAETVLLERLGLGDLAVGHCPRVHISVDYRRPLHVRELVDIVLGVAAVGRSSVSYELVVREGGEVAAKGDMVAVLVGPEPGSGAVAWPPAARRALLGGGAVAGERYEPVAAVREGRQDQPG